MYSKNDCLNWVQAKLHKIRDIQGNTLRIYYSLHLFDDTANCREVSGRRIGYSQAGACSYADPARPLYRVQAERQKLRCSIFLFCAKPSASTVRTKQKNLCLSKGFCRNRLVGETGFEPATLCSQSRCANRAALHPERSGGRRACAGRGDVAAKIPLFSVTANFRRPDRENPWTKV